MLRDISRLQRSFLLEERGETYPAGYAGGENILYDNYNSQMITKRSAQMYCQTGAPSFPVVEATIAKAHAVSCLPISTLTLQRLIAYSLCSSSIVVT